MGACSPCPVVKATLAGESAAARCTRAAAAGGEDGGPCLDPQELATAIAAARTKRRIPEYQQIEPAVASRGRETPEGKNRQGAKTPRSGLS
jgi:hypothetical protein